MRISIVTDAWHPQINGVIRVLESIRGELVSQGHTVNFITPGDFHTAPCPTYPEIRLALFAKRKLFALLDSQGPDAIHIATEGPLGLAARRYCLKRGYPFTTAYHSKFPEYIAARSPVPLEWMYKLVKWFHGASSGILAPSPSVFRELTERGFENMRRWSHGVDLTEFRPGPSAAYFADLPRPIHMYVGRVTVEKNLPAFLDLDLPGSKVVVGEGPMRLELEKRYPDVVFRPVHASELAACYNAADVFVFPSRTDTFGLVMLEAMACGKPVAAFPVTGPLDVVDGSGAGALDEDLVKAIELARSIPPETCLARAREFSWATVAEQFLGFLHPIPR